MQIKRKDVEAVRLELAREQEFAEAEQLRRIASPKREQEEEAERFRFSQELQTRETEIAKERQIREAELAREVYLLEKERERQLAELLREQRVEEARRQKDVRARHIDSIRVLDVNGLGAAGASRDGAGHDPIRRVFDALLGTGAALPMLRELLGFARENGLVDKLEEALPGLKKVVELRRPSESA